MSSVIQLVDCHAHLCDPCFDPDRAEVLARARAAGVARVVAVSETLDDARRTLDLAREHPQIAPAAGLYPTYLDRDQCEAVMALCRQATGSLVAIGEVGLDYWKVKEEPDREIQREILRLQVRLARELDLPLNVHSRSAGRHAIALLLQEGATRVLLHAFDGKASSALPGAEAGFYFSIPASIVRSPQKQKLVRRLPLERLCVESDAPVLGVEKGRRNEPAAARTAAETIAEIKGVSLQEVAETTTRNAEALFFRPRAAPA